MVKRSALIGYNHNVRYAGRLFHVQTEDSGTHKPHIYTHLFFGGTILATKRSDYEPDADVARVQKTMQVMHKEMLLELRGGRHDAALEKFFGEPIASLEPADSARKTEPSLAAAARQSLRAQDGARPADAMSASARAAAGATTLASSPSTEGARSPSPSVAGAALAEVRAEEAQPARTPSGAMAPLARTPSGPMAPLARTPSGPMAPLARTPSEASPPLARTPSEASPPRVGPAMPAASVVTPTVARSASASASPSASPTFSSSPAPRSPSASPFEIGPTEPTPLVDPSALAAEGVRAYGDGQHYPRWPRRSVTPTEPREAVIARPTVIVSAPGVPPPRRTGIPPVPAPPTAARLAAARAATRDRPTQSIFGEPLDASRSLDDAILRYLAEEIDES